MYNQQEYTYENWISQFKSMTKLSEQLQFILLILNSLEGDSQEQFYNELTKFEEYFTDQEFMRKVKARDALIDSNPAEYYGRDFGEDDPYQYDQELEKNITEISMDILTTLGRVIKLMKSRDIAIPDEIS